MIRHLLLVCLAASVTACASSRGHESALKEPALTPTQQFTVTVTHHPDEILLAPHAFGLSPAQATAVSELADRWRDSGDGPVIIESPVGGGADAYRGATAVQAALARLGVTEDRIRLVSYQSSAASTGVSPIIVGFAHFEAQVPQCGRDWKDYTKTFSNGPNSNFGCAVTANFGAMVANPSDLANPRTMDPPDANRRETILGKYRKGDATSSTKDTQANGAVSAVLN